MRLATLAAHGVNWKLPRVQRGSDSTHAHIPAYKMLLMQTRHLPTERHAAIAHRGRSVMTAGLSSCAAAAETYASAHRPPPPKNTHTTH
jgi:hypothetical protein